MPASGSVLLDRKYFKELLRRADCSAANNNGAERAFEHAILIPKDEYEALQQITRRFVHLCDNLRAGGVEEDALTTLWGGDEDEEVVEPPRQAPPPPRHNNARVGNGSNGHSSNTYNNNSSSNANTNHVYEHKKNGNILSLDTSSNNRSAPKSANGSSSDLVSDEGRGDASPTSYDFEDSNLVDPSEGSQSGAVSSPRSGAPERQSLRTIQIVNLPEIATLADVADAVRGGPLLELYIRAHDRSAFVSFVRGPDAKEFFDHVRKHDLYIKTKRVEVRWSERQFTLLPHVGAQINQGATRNMTIFQCDPRITEEFIRKDLEHIHNLVLYSIKFANGNCYIKANSVHNAMFARSNLMSRVAYKGSRIEWAPDECADPLPVIAPKPRNNTKKKSAAKKPPTFSAPNRFQLLKIKDEDKPSEVPANDDDEDGEEDVAFPMP